MIDNQHYQICPERKDEGDFRKGTHHRAQGAINANSSSSAQTEGRPTRPRIVTKNNGAGSMNATPPQLPIGIATKRPRPADFSAGANSPQRLCQQIPQVSENSHIYGTGTAHGGPSRSGHGVQPSAGQSRRQMSSNSRTPTRPSATTPSVNGPMSQSPASWPSGVILPQFDETSHKQSIKSGHQASNRHQSPGFEPGFHGAHSDLMNPALHIYSPRGNHLPPRVDSYSSNHSNGHPHRSTPNTPGNSQQRHERQSHGHPNTPQYSAQSDTANGLLQPQMLPRVRESQNQHNPPPLNSKDALSHWRQPLPEPRTIARSAVGYELAIYLKAYLNVSVRNCPCGLYWLKSAVCRHTYTAFAFTCGGTNDKGVTAYCKPGAQLNINVTGLLVDHACDPCCKRALAKAAEDMPYDTPDIYLDELMELDATSSNATTYIGY